jgi:hypothetical protein
MSYKRLTGQNINLIRSMIELIITIISWENAEGGEGITNTIVAPHWILKGSDTLFDNYVPS